MKPYKGKPPIHLFQEEPRVFNDQDKILEPEDILRHEDNVLRSGKVLHRYLIRSKHYPPEDAQWMQETQLNNNPFLLKDYKMLHQLQETM